MIRKTLAGIFISLCVMIALLASLVSWVLFTETGTAQLFSVLADKKLLSYQALQGALGRELRLGKLVLEPDGQAITLEKITLASDFSEILFGTLRINHISAGEVGISYQQRQRTENAEPRLTPWLTARQTFVPFELVLAAVHIERLTITGNRNPFTLSDIRLSARADRQGLDAIGLRLRYADTHIQLSGQTRLAPRLSIRLNLNWSHPLQHAGELTGSAHIRGDHKALQIHHRTSGALVSSVRLQFSHWQTQPVVSGRGFIERLAWPQARINRPALAQISLQVQGKWPQLQVKAEGAVYADGTPWARLETVMRLTPEQLQIRHLDLKDQTGGSASVTGSLRWPEGAPHWQGTVGLKAFDARALQAQLPDKLTGEIALSGHLREGLQLKLKSDALTGVVKNQPLRLQLALAYENEQLAVTAFEATAGNSTLSLAGTVQSNRIDLNFDTQLTDLNLLHTKGHGALTARGAISGAWQNPTIIATFSGEGLAFAGLSAHRLQGSIKLTEGHFSPTENHVTLQQMRYQNLALESVRLTARGDWPSPLLGLDAAAPDTHLNAQGQIRFQQGRIEASLSNLKLQFEGFTQWTLSQPVSFSYQADGWQLTELHLASDRAALRFSASGDNTQLKMDLSAQRLPTGLLAQILPTPIRIKGLIDIEADFAGNFTQHRGHLRIIQSQTDSPLQFVTEDTTLPPLTFSDLNYQARISNSTLTGQLTARLNETGRFESAFEVKALFTPHSPLAASIQFRLPELAPYAALLPEIDALSGDLEGTLKFSNTLQQPRLQLDSRLRIPRLYISALAIELTELEAHITSGAGSVQQLQASARAGEGYVQLSGRLRPDSDTGWLSEMHLTGAQALLMDHPKRRLVATPDLRLRVSPAGLTARGQLHIPEAFFKHTRSPQRLTLTSDAVIHGKTQDQTEARQPFDYALNVEVALGEAVTFEAYGLKTGVTGNLTLSRSPPGNLLAQGTLTLVEGAYRAYGQDLTIDRGIVSFSGPLNQPTLELTATRTVKTVKAGVLVSGRVDNLRTRLFSEPALTDNEILSYILRGKPLSEAGAADKQALANALLAYSISQSAPVTSRLAELSGLDELGLEAEEDIETLGFTLGKYLTPRLYARYGIGVVDKLSKLFLQYQLTDKLFLETESGKGQSIDLIYRSH